MRDDCAHVRNVGNLELAVILRNVLLGPTAAIANSAAPAVATMISTRVTKAAGTGSPAATLQVKGTGSAPHATPVSCPAQVVKFA